ncbi:MAG: hypothetical protein M3526_05745, partial [Actinomycetota bacterium]|nr:hypothetical protein [Actinomycetota bacterium]
MDVEPVRIGEPARIAVRRREHRPDQRALLERHAGELGLLRGLPGRGSDRTRPSKRLLDGVLDQRAVGADLLELLGMRPERDHGQRDQVARLLQAAGEHELGVRDDLVTGHRLTRPVVVEHPRQD